MTSISFLKSLKSTSFVIVLALILSLQFILIDAHGGISDDDHGDAPVGHDDSSNTSKNINSRKLIIVKIWCLVIFFLNTFAFGVSPYFLRWDENFLVLGTQFAGGVFLGTSMIHFLSDSSSVFNTLTSLEYPFAFMLACAGYVLTMFGDCIIMYIAEKSAGIKRVGVEGNRGEEEPEKHEDMEHNPIFIRTTSVGNTFLLIVALCFHSIFEGIAVGIADTEADAWKNLWTISLHKVFGAIAMGIALLQMIPKRPLLATVMYSFAFAISSPIGVGIGIAIDATTEGRTADWTYAISMGFATGIFIYIAINHLISKGYKPRSPCYFDTPFYRFLAVLFGVAVIAVVMIWD